MTTVDPRLLAALTSASWVRVIVTVRASGDVSDPFGGPSASPGPSAAPGGAASPGWEPGPFRRAKAGVAARAGDGLRLVRDFSNLPVFSAQVRDSSTLLRMVTDPGVAGIEPESRMTTS